MAFRAGTTSAFYLANAANALQNLSPYIDNVSAPQSVNQLDVTAFGTAAHAYIPGLQGGDQVAISGPYDAAVYTQLTVAQQAGSLLGFIWGPGGSVASQARIAGSVYVQNTTIASTVDGRVEWNASLQVSGTVSNGTF